jgi:hypothetical protein
MKMHPVLQLIFDLLSFLTIRWFSYRIESKNNDALPCCHEKIHLLSPFTIETFSIFFQSPLRFKHEWIRDFFESGIELSPGIRVELFRPFTHAAGIRIKAADIFRNWVNLLYKLWSKYGVFSKMEDGYRGGRNPSLPWRLL